MQHTEIEGALAGQGLRIGIVVARFNSLVTENLLAGALAGLRRHGVADNAVTVVKVPGPGNSPSPSPPSPPPKNSTGSSPSAPSSAATPRTSTTSPAKPPKASAAP